MWAGGRGSRQIAATSSPEPVNMPDGCTSASRRGGLPQPLLIVLFESGVERNDAAGTLLLVRAPMAVRRRNVGKQVVTHGGLERLMPHPSPQFSVLRRFTGPESGRDTRCFLLGMCPAALQVNAPTFHLSLRWTAPPSKTALAKSGPSHDTPSPRSWIASREQACGSRSDACPGPRRQCSHW